MAADAWGFENAKDSRLTELLWLCTSDSGLGGFLSEGGGSPGDSRAGPTRWEPGQHARYAKLIADQKTITRRRRPSRATMPATAPPSMDVARLGDSTLRGWAEATLSRASRDPRVATTVLVLVAIIPALLQLIMAAETAKAMGVALRLVR